MSKKSFNTPKEIKCPNGYDLRYGYVRYKCRCKACILVNKKYGKEYRKKNRGRALELAAKYRNQYKDKINARARQYRENETFKTRMILRKKIVDEIKTDLGCIDCGFKDHPSALHFDHVRGIKLFNIGNKYKCPIESLLAEIEKCDVRCANCHAIKTCFEKRKAAKRERRDAKKEIKKEK